MESSGRDTIYEPCLALFVSTVMKQEGTSLLRSDQSPLNSDAIGSPPPIEAAYPFRWKLGVAVKVLRLQ